MKASISTVRQAIADTGATITGIKKTFTRAPVKIDTAEVPCLVVITGNSIFPNARLEGSTIDEQAEYIAQVIVAPVGQSNIETIEADAEALMELTIAKFMATPALGIDFVRSSVTGCSPVIELAGYDSIWLGFEVRLQVEQTYLREY